MQTGSDMMSDSKKMQEALALMELLAMSRSDIDAGKSRPAAEVFAELDLEFSKRRALRDSPIEPTAQ